LDLPRRTTAVATSNTSRAFWENLFRSTRRLPLHDLSQRLL
jgi:hypothetical protein